MKIEDLVYKTIKESITDFFKGKKSHGYPCIRQHFPERKAYQVSYWRA